MIYNVNAIDLFASPVANDNYQERLKRLNDVDELLPCEIEVEWTAAEVAEIEEAAASWGLSLHEYVRRVSLDYRLDDG